MAPSRILFIPVSSPSGIGEYIRSVIIANALQVRWPNSEIHFILNEQVSYIKDCDYKVHTCVGSPTKDAANVNRIIAAVNPDLVIFDASGRASQFKQAKKCGAKVAFIAQHNKKRARGLKLNRLFNTDIHWVVQPDYCMKTLSIWQRAKLAVFNKKAPVNIGPVFELSEQNSQLGLLAQYNLIADDFIVFNAGSGGHKVKGKLAADIYYQAAQQLQAKTSMKAIVVFGSNYPKELPDNSDVLCIKTIENKNFISLLNKAKGCVITAGDTLLQCITLQKLCVASAVSPDQPARLALCQQQHLVFAAEPNPESLVEQATLIFADTRANVVIEHMKNKTAINALTTIVDDIAVLFASAQDRANQNATNQDDANQEGK